MTTLLQDIRFAVRALRRTPGFTIIAIVTLALGIGANTAVFSVINGVLLRPLPFAEPDRFTHLGWDWGEGGPQGWVSAYKYDYWRRHTSSFEAVATFRQLKTGIGVDGADGGVAGLRVPAEFFGVIGVQPALGRAIRPDESRPGGARVAVLGHDFWQRQFGGEAGILGRQVVVGGDPHTVVGVMPPGFAFPQAPENTEILVPLQMQIDPQDAGHNYPLIARVESGVTAEQAQADLDRVFQQFRTEHPDLVGRAEDGMALASYQDLYAGGLRPVLWILLGAIGMVLLIACANVANLLLARATGRQRELAIRTALGAGRGRIIRQLTIESVVLSVAAAVAALLLAGWGVEALLALAPSGLPRGDEIGIDWRVLLFAFAVAVGTGLLFGAAAAVPSSRPEVGTLLRQSGRGQANGRSRARGALIVTESALAMVLLVGAGLLIGTLQRLIAVDPGFEADGLMTASFERTPQEYQGAAAIWEFERQLLERLKASPAISAAAGATNPPLRRGWNIPVTIAGRPDAFEGAAEWRAVTPGYLDALGVSLTVGRDLTPADVAGAPRVALVNEAFAKHYFPDEDPIGQQIEIGKYDGRYIDPSYEVPAALIVGVVRDVREMSLKRDAARTILVPQAQAQDGMTSFPVLLLRTDRPDMAAASLRQALEAIDPRIPAPTIQPMSEIVGASVAQERFNAMMMAVFAALALLLTAVGVYGVVAYSVNQRTREIGLRIALGAAPRQVVRMVTGQGMLPVVIGLGIGAVAALMLTRFLESMIWGVSATDPRNFILVSLVLTSVAAVASWLPARRATRVDPLVALRDGE